MNTVIIVNLNRNAFHLEEPGYHALRIYLERARSQLQDNPDRTEIMSDLEQAIADKCTRFLNPHKNVMIAADIEEILKEMGDVQTDGAADSGSGGTQTADQRAAPAHSPTRKRLYQIREGSMISGVCNGIAAYLNIDVTLVRVAAVVLTLLSKGVGALLYIIMMLVIPFANTDEERAAAAGTPFNAQEVIDRAKKHYGEFKNSKEWRRHWRAQRREWRRKWRDGAAWSGYNLQRNMQQFSARSGYGAQIVAGLMIPCLAIANILVFCLLIAAIVALTTTGTLFGWQVAASMPLWVAVLILVFVYNAIASPMRYARRAVLLKGPYDHSLFAAWDGLLSFALLFLIGWLAYSYVPEVHEFFDHFLENWQTMLNNLIDSFHRPAATRLPEPSV